jgi:hypothetical protein
MTRKTNLVKKSPSDIIKIARESDYYLGGSMGTGRGTPSHALALHTVPIEPILSPPPFGGTGGGTKKRGTFLLCT